MGAVTRRGFLSGCAAVGLGAAAAATLPVTAAVPAARDSLTDFYAVADGTYNPVTHEMTGTDNTAAINAALASGKPVVVPPGHFYYSGTLHTDVEGSGLIGSGSQASFLITDQDLDRHIAVVKGTKNTQWTNFGMIGPFSNDGKKYNRALTIGMNSTLTDTASNAWDATGTWIDDFATYGYCVGVHVARADFVQFGTIEVFEAGDSRAEPGAYGVTCSGSNLNGKLLRAINTTRRARHALYYNGPANDCFVDEIEAKGFDFAAIQNRATTGGGRRNGFARGRFEDCNTNSVVEPVKSLRGVVTFASENDVAVDGAGGARVGDYTAIDCGGFPGPSLRYMPNSICGTVQVYGHAGFTHFSTADHYGSYIYFSDDVELPLLIFVSGFDVAGLNDATFKPLVVEDSSDCYGGGVRMHSGAVFAAE